MTGVVATICVRRSRITVGLFGEVAAWSRALAANSARKLSLSRGKLLLISQCRVDHMSLVIRTTTNVFLGAVKRSERRLVRPIVVLRDMFHMTGGIPLVNMTGRGFKRTAFCYVIEL